MQAWRLAAGAGSISASTVGVPDRDVFVFIWALNMIQLALGVFGRTAMGHHGFFFVGRLPLIQAGLQSMGRSMPQVLLPVCFTASIQSSIARGQLIANAVCSY